MVKIINLTPHTIVVCDADGNAVRKIEPSGQVARAKADQQVVGQVDGIDVVKSVLSQVEDLPGPVEDTIYLVSSLVAQAVAGRLDVVAPDTGPTAVRDDQGRIAGVRRFQQF